MRGLALAMVSVLLACGCGAGDDAAPARRTTLAGTEVARMAETQLEQENPRIARGSMTCPSLSLRLGAEVRCHRVALLDGGRELRMSGTVRVNSVAGQGRLRVRLDETFRYGVSAGHLAADLRARLGSRGIRADRVDCPWLSGPAGTVARCSVTVGKKRLVSRARVTGRDDATQTTRYVWEGFPSLPPSTAP